MQVELNSRPLELDIREHFSLFSDVAIVIQQLLQKYGGANLSVAELETLGSLSLKSGQGPAYVQFSVQRLSHLQNISWPHFATALVQSCDSLPTEVLDAVVAGAMASDAIPQLSRSHEFDFAIADNAEKRAQRRQQHQKQYADRREELMAQVDMLRLQELEADEERVLKQLLRLCPMDSEIIRLYESLKERKAVQMLEDKLQHHQTPWDQSEKVALETEEKEALDVILNSMHLQWSNSGFDEDLGHDFAIALLMWEYPEAAMDFLPEHSASAQIRWTRMEVLLLSRHYVALLNAIDSAESSAAQAPDHTFALMYLKALALWGLGHRFAAVEIIEGIVNYRPDYRSAMTLLHLWKGGTS